MSTKSLLSMKGVCKRFPGVLALDKVDFTLQAGEVHALVGENGAGKSTLIKVLGGIYQADEGEIFIHDKKVSIHSVADSQKNGIAIIHQELVVVPHMTVAENIFLGKEIGRGLFINRKKMMEKAQALLNANQISISADTQIKDLTIAQQQMVEIVKAISYQSKILVMDEPTSSISDKEVTFLFATMRKLVKKGVGIVYISHKMSELEQVCDRVTVMRDGKHVETRLIHDTTKDELVSLMVGRELTNYYTRDFFPLGEEVLRCENLSDGNILKDVSFHVHKGEIVGFAGLTGAGRSETAKAIFGLHPITKGNLYINGKKVVIRSPNDAVKNGLALVPENRKEEGIYPVQSVRFNTTIEILNQFIRFLKVNKKKEEEIAQSYMDMLNTKTPSLEQKINNLSGGNQQKVLIGRWLATDPQILILDEPTRGIDVGAKSEIYMIMNQLIAQGMSIIMISSELPEIVNMSDRIYVMADGKLAGCMEHSDATQEKIMNLAAK